MKSQVQGRKEEEAGERAGVTRRGAKAVSYATNHSQHLSTELGSRQPSRII